MSSGYRLSFPSGKAAQNEADRSLTTAADLKNSWRYGFALPCVGIAWLHTKHRKAFVLPLTTESWNKYVYLKKYAFIWAICGHYIKGNFVVGRGDRLSLKQ